MGLAALNIRSWREVVHAAEAGNHAFERGRNRGLRDVGEVRFSLHLKGVDLGLEGLFDLGSFALENDPVGLGPCARC